MRSQTIGLHRMGFVKAPRPPVQELAVNENAPTPPTTPMPGTASRLSGIRALPHDEDERQSREDLDYGQTIFTRGTVELPRWLRGGKHRKRGRQP
jgi:hypothetical protein